MIGSPHVFTNFITNFFPRSIFFSILSNQNKYYVIFREKFIDLEFKIGEKNWWKHVVSRSLSWFYSVGQKLANILGTIDYYLINYFYWAVIMTSLVRGNWSKTWIVSLKLDGDAILRPPEFFFFSQFTELGQKFWMNFDRNFPWKNLGNMSLVS